MQGQPPETGGHDYESSQGEPVEGSFCRSPRSWPSRLRSSQQPRQPPRTAAAPLKLAILSDCQGAFGAFYEADIGGAQAAIHEVRARQARRREEAVRRMNRIILGGRQVKIVGYGCSNDTAAKAIAETKRLMEKLGADIMIGPLSGDEGIAVANYAKAASRRRRSSTAPRARRTRRSRCGRRTSSASTVTARSGRPVSATSPSTGSAGRRRPRSPTTTRSRGRRRAARSPSSALSAARSRSGSTRR